MNDAAKPQKRFPPVPDWQPAIALPHDQLIERLQFYLGGRNDFAIFAHGTLVVLPDGLDEDQATTHALQALHGVYHAHPDLNPLQMKDGNILIQYHNNVLNIVLADLVESHWAEINAHHQDALATDEVLITPAGPNRFDDFGKKALFGRCYMFMDAQAPAVVAIVRRPA